MIIIRIVTKGSHESDWLADQREFDVALAAITEQARAARKPQLIELRPGKGYGFRWWWVATIPM